MESKQAIISFSESEKVKAGLIWCSQCLQLALNLEPEAQQGAIQMVRSLISMIANEAQLARKITSEDVWLEVDKSLSTARVMLDSGVAQEATYHLTQSLSQVNRIGQQSMSALIERGLLA